MNPIRVCDLRTSALLVFAALGAFLPAPLQAQFAAAVDSQTRYAGNSTGTNFYSGDSGAATTTSLNAPSYAVLDSSGNLFISDTANNCIRKVDTAGNLTTVAGLRVNGGPDTCNAALNPTPSAAQGLLAPTGLALDSAGTLYIADSLHHCVRSLATGAVDSFAANALVTVAGTCTSTDTASVTPVPNGLAVDSARNLYISVRDSAAPTPVNQVLLHAAGAPATSVCYLAGQPSANVPNVCSGITGAATLSSPAALTFDQLGNLFIADTGNNCVRELAGLATLQTAVGQCANDGSSGSTASLTSPYGLAVTPANALLITQSAALQNSLISYSFATGATTLIAGLPSGAAGPYSSVLDGQSAISSALNAPLGLTTDQLGNIYLADSGNNVIRKLTSNLNFGTVALGSTSSNQTVTFQINRVSNLTASVGADYSITSNTCSGSQSPAGSGLVPATCQVSLAFAPTRPGSRNSALRLTDSTSGNVVSVALSGTGTGPLSLLTPGIVGTLASGLRTPIAVSVDSSGNTYVLEQGNAASTADILLYPAGGGAPTIVIPQGGGLATPTAMAVDAAGNIFVAEASNNTISRFGADGSVNLSYVNGVQSVSALTLDGFDNLYIAQAGSVHSVTEAYSNGGSRTIAGSGSTPHADGVAAVSALFVKPSGLALSPNNTLAVADASDQYVYTIDTTGTIHILAGNGTSSSTNTTQATGTAILNPNGLAYDAAGNLYIADQSANLVYEVFPFQSSGSNILIAVGTGGSGYSGDDGSAALATLNGPLTVALDGSANLYVVDYGNNALREVTYPTSATLDFGHVVIGNSPTKVETIINAGNASLSITGSYTPSDNHFTTSGPITTCAGSVTNGGFCKIGYTFTPTVQGQVTATSTVASNDTYNTPQVVNLTAFGIVTQLLPYTLATETEVYGSAFTQSASLNFAFPDLPPTGTISFSISGNQTCSKSATAANPFGPVVNCNAANSFLHVLQSPYTVNFTYNSGDIDYSSTTGTTTLTVTPAPLTVTSPNITVPYGAGFTFPTPAATLTTAVNGDVFIPTDSTTGSKTSPPGTYTISTALTPAGGASTSDYNITYVPGVLTITQANLSVTPTNLSRPYGAANPVFTGTVVGAANGDTFTVTYSTTATPASPVGTYPITASITGANIADYVVTQNVGTLTVTPAPLTVNVASATRSYGTVNPTFSATVTGAVNGDTFTQTLSTPAGQFSPVGAYSINDVLSGAATANYSITVNPGTLTITRATGVVTVTANDASRTYGAPNPVFTSTVTGALNGDTFTITYTTTATAASPLGTYPITPIISGPNAANYTVVPVNGTLTVTPSPLTVAANNTSRSYDTPNPTFTSTITGLFNGDTVNVVYATTATLTSPVGTYPIVPTASGAALSNYALTTTNGTLTVTPSAATPLTVAVNNSTRSFGTANPVFTGSVTGLLNRDTVAVTYSSVATAASAPGTYLITAVVSGAAAANYVINIVPGTLAITQAATAVSVTTSSSPAYYGTPITFTASVNSAGGTPTGTVTFLNGNTVLGTATLSGAGVATFNTSSLLPGTATITANYSGDLNFAASSASLSEVVSAGSFSLAASPATQFVRGAGTTVYTITATSAQGFNGPVALACAGLPSDATCTFASPTLTVSANGTATTTMTVTSTAADAKLLKPVLPSRNTAARIAPVAFAATLPFELTGLGVLFAGTRRKRRWSARSPRLRVLLLLLGTAALMGLAGCACFTSVYKNYTITVTGTSTVPGVASQSASVILSVGQQ